MKRTENTLLIAAIRLPRNFLKKWMFIFISMLSLTQSSMAARIAQVVWCYDNHTLYFINSDTKYKAGDIYDGQTVTAAWSGTTVTESGNERRPAWYGYSNSSCTRVVFDKAFSTVRPITCYGWFALFSKLISIEGIKYLNTSKVTNMVEMFDQCRELETIDVSGFNTTNVTKMSAMFQGCTKLKSLDVSIFDTSNVTDMGGMFSACSSLESLDLSHFNTANVRNMNGMFMNCKKLESLDVSNFDTKNVTDMTWIFRECSCLKSLDLSSFDTSKLTDFSCMFLYCSKLESLNVCNFNTSKAINMGSMFEGCAELTTLDLSHFETSKVYSMKYMFNGCSKLTTIYASELWTTEQVNDWNWNKTMFNACNCLVSERGTVYDNSHIDNSYARIDGGVEAPGYFTYKASGESIPAMPYALLSEDFKTLTFYYDNMKYEHNSLDVGPFTENRLKAWDGHASTITDVIFDTSFANYTDIISTAYWFYSCSSLTNISGMKYLNTSEVTDMSSMFDGCVSLTAVDLSSLNTEKVTNLACMFYECSSLVTLDLSRFSTANVTDMHEMFFDCSSLTTIYAGINWNTKNVTSDNDMFVLCEKLVGSMGTVWNPESLGCKLARFDGGADAPGYLTAKIEDYNPTDEPYAVLTKDNTVLTFYFGKEKAVRLGMGIGPFSDAKEREWHEMASSIEEVIFDDSFRSYTELTSTSRWFEYCSHLVTIKGLNNLKTENVTEMSRMFEECRSLTSIDLRGINTASLTNIHGMLHGCSSLKTINMEGFNTSKVVDMGHLFGGCSSLTSIDISGLDTSSAMDVSELFDGCSSLTSIDLSALCTDNATNMIEMFNGCSSLTSLDVSRLNTEKVMYMAGMFSGCKSLTSIDVSNFKTSNLEGKYGMRSMFSGCSSLTAIDLSNFNTEKITQMSDLFKGCSSLTSLNLSSFNTGNVERMGSMFEGCSSLISLNIAHFNTAKVTDMNSMFKNCQSLTCLNLENFNTENVEKMNSMFDGCRSLTDLNIKSFNTISATDMGAMFSSCYKLTSINLRSFNTGKVTNMDGMFSECRALSSLNLAKFNTEKVTSMSSMFYNCTSLKYVELRNFNMSAVEYMGNMFSNCKELEELNLTSFSPSTVKYAGGMFSGCSQLKTIYVCEKWSLPDNARGIGMFSECMSLVGGKGTQFKDSYVNINYARIDGGAYAPGYFTAKAWEDLFITPFDEDDSVDFGGGIIDADTELNGTIVGNVYINIPPFSGEYDDMKKCLVLKATMDKNAMEAISDQDPLSDEVKQTFIGIALMVPPGEGKVMICASAVGDVNLAAKVGNADPVKFELEGKLKVRVRYNVTVPTYVYVYACGSASGTRNSVTEQGSLMIYGIEREELKAGDANDDGRVNVADIVEVVNYLQGNPSERFNYVQGDADGNGSVDKTDIQAIVNKVMSQE